MSLYDRLTGVYNRTYFEEEMRRLGDSSQNPVGLIMCDVDGLKFVNDTMGHDEGDCLLASAARVIKKCIRRNDVVARIGGDEFAIIMTKTSERNVKKAYERLKQGINRYNESNPRIPLSLSFGYAVYDGERESLSELFREADNNMYQEKLHRSSSIRSGLVNTLMKTLEARDYISEGHTERLQEMVTRFAEALNLQENTINSLRLLAQFHDVGKVGIPDRILFKAGSLNHEERKEMQSHPKIGYRIARSAPDLVPISECILKTP